MFSQLRTIKTKNNKPMKTICLAILLMAVMTCTGYINAQEVVAPAGNHHTTSQGSVSWTLGETVISFYSNDQFLLTQGFQHGMITISTLVGHTEWAAIFQAYPNPAGDHLIITSQKEFNWSVKYELFGLEGKVMQHGGLLFPETKIDVHHLLPGAYFIRIYQHHRLLTTFKILKQ